MWKASNFINKQGNDPFLAEQRSAHAERVLCFCGICRQNEPERFYHGFVLGLIADQTDIYEIRSNRESGFGRYDVMMIPKIKETKKYPAIIMEFKVRNIKREESLEDTVQTALTQIKEKCYDAELYDRGLKKEEIHHYGFAFEGKKVLIG